MQKRRKTPIGTAWVDAEGILWHRLDFGARVTAELASQTAAVILDLTDGAAVPAIVDIGEIQYADEDAREMFARLRCAVPEIATALLVRPSVNPAPSVLAERFSELEADRPIAVFQDEQEAVAWARQFLQSA